MCFIASNAVSVNFTRETSTFCSARPSPLPARAPGRCNRVLIPISSPLGTLLTLKSAINASTNRKNAHWTRGFARGARLTPQTLAAATVKLEPLLVANR